jgi:sporulation protein YqfC
VNAVAGEHGKIRQKIAETLELPKDVVMDVPKVTLIGNVQLNIENHRGIVEYNENYIRINTSIGTLKITGSSLVIKDIVSDEIVLTGCIENIDISS